MGFRVFLFLEKIMKIFYSAAHLQHDPVGDWEVTARGQRILSALTAGRMGEVLTPEEWGMGPITAVHTPALLTFLQGAYAQMQQETPGAPLVPNCFAVRHLAGRLPRTIWGQLGYFCTDVTTPILAATWEAAYWAAQTAVSAADFVLRTGETAYALCRPPGHHAFADLYGGYCYLNNAAVAAEWLARRQKKVAILDLDYHHGNGTQAIFYTRSDVLFCSIHAIPDWEYPFFSGYTDEQGAMSGRGYTINFPLPLGTTGAEYYVVAAHAVAKIKAFHPDILLISLGVDTAAGDPNGGFLLQESDFHTLGQLLSALPMPKLVVQEGGYLLERIGADVATFLRGLSVSPG
jgi:acetoin utilization deacetylase AcuC-like enzyme